MQERHVSQLVEQNVRRGAISNLAAGQQKPDRAAETIGQGMDFGGATATRATNCLILLPPFRVVPLVVV